MKFTILDTELEYDFLDADAIEKAEKSLQQAQDELQAMEKENSQLSPSQRIRKYCKPFHNMFDNLFGPGTAQKVFKGKDNYGDCLQATAQLTAAERKAVSADELMEIKSQG